VTRLPRPGEHAAAQAIWEASHSQDDAGGRQRGGWSLAAWATDWRVLTIDERVVGVAAVRTSAEGSRELVQARTALDPQWRAPEAADRLVHACLGLARTAGGQLVRQWIPSRAEWARAAAQRAGCEQVRTVFHMLRPADAPAFDAPPPPELRIRSIRPGEEPSVLAALNRAWAGTWDFMPIRLEQLEHDLEDQREGMLLGVTDADEIIATCHAVFDAHRENPDGAPHAWISNLTVEPAFRGRGVARTMLAAGIAHLRARGATSVTLGVDADDPAL
jgi:mycothiol synthase